MNEQKDQISLEGSTVLSEYFQVAMFLNGAFENVRLLE